MSSPLEKSKPCPPVTAATATDTVTTSNRKSKVAGLFSSEDDDSNNKNQLQIIINKLEDENKSLKIKNQTLEATPVVVSSKEAAATPTPTESSTILAPFVASVLRDQTLAELLHEVKQLQGQKELEQVRIQNAIANLSDITGDMTILMVITQPGPEQ